MADQDRNDQQDDPARLKGGMGQQDAAQGQSREQTMSGDADQGYGETGFEGGPTGMSGQVSGQDQGGNAGGPSGLDQNDQAGGGLGQNQTGYGGSTEQDSTGGQGPGEVKQGAQGQTGHLGPAPGAGVGQPRSATTGGPDLSKGLSDQNQGGGGI